MITAYNHTVLGGAVIRKDTANILHNISKVLVNINIVHRQSKWNASNIPIDSAINNPPTCHGSNILRI